ncbi:MAG: hypothetical protein NVS2B12_25400 [Ktedonobacteraceae bacterium]
MGQGLHPLSRSARQPYAPVVKRGNICMHTSYTSATKDYDGLIISLSRRYD